jgi:hypothetical protein
VQVYRVVVVSLVAVTIVLLASLLCGLAGRLCPAAGGERLVLLLPGEAGGKASYIPLS